MFFDDYSEMLNGTLSSLKREEIQQLFDMIEETRKSGKHLFLLGLHLTGYVTLERGLTQKIPKGLRFSHQWTMELSLVPLAMTAVMKRPFLNR